jgi:hypothetical protein
MNPDRVPSRPGKRRGGFTGFTRNALPRPDPPRDLFKRWAGRSLRGQDKTPIGSYNVYPTQEI